jgi:hypothetical protein
MTFQWQRSVPQSPGGPVEKEDAKQKLAVHAGG